MNALTTGAYIRGGAQPPWVTGLFLAVAAGLWLYFGPAPEALVFDRAALAQGEWWRWLTGHLVHSDGQHALWDIAALGLIGGLMEHNGRRRMAAATLAGLVAVNVCLMGCLPGLDRYCGLSGVLNTLFVVALADLWRQRRHPAIPLAGLGLILKLAAEMATHQSLVVDMQWPGVPEAHLAGCVGGMGFLAIERLSRRSRCPG